ncbi:AAA family ATPase [uncultured Thiodictyon sp.]|uniref:AAA family ATPase n=1 Tax=uncultured Thiodictyon sp. TaxID=1846217 RepID=UPI0025D868FA|nr:AAA family ATPase [uncultured Thiodictyon sp.]
MGDKLKSFVERYTYTGKEADPLDDKAREAIRKRKLRDQARLDAITKPLKQAAPFEPGITLVSASSIKPEPIAWLWPGWLARGKVHVMAGAPGTGKTTAAVSLGSTLTVGGHWPDGSRCRAGSVLMWSGEDDPRDTLVPRLIAAGADLDRFHFVDSCIDARGPRPFDLATDVDVLSAHLASMNPAPALLIVDPIVSAVSGDSNQGSAVRRALQPLVELAQDRRCAILGISHFSKGTQGRDPTERVTGSLSFGAVARVVMATAKLPDHEGGGRILVRSKSNIGMDSGGFRYALEHCELVGIGGVPATRVVWGAAMDGTARELLSLADTDTDPEEQTEQQEAGDWLRELLSQGSRRFVDIVKAAKENGFSERTVRRARKDIDATVTREGFGGGSSWSLPAEKENTACIPAKDDPFRPASGAGRNGGNVAGIQEVCEKAEDF